MSLKTGLLFVTLLIGSFAIPAQDQDMSIFFEHTNAQARIVGGTIADSVPYMVVLSSGVLVRSFVCGGSVITNRHVITAAHCIEALFSGGRLLNSLRGTVGTNRWNSGGTQYKFASNITHPHYVQRTLKNDLGILITTTEITFSNAVQTVVLSDEFVDAGVSTTVTGWGSTAAGGPLSQNLLQLSAVVIDGERCVTEMRDRALEFNIINVPPVEPHIEICTFHSTGHGTCNGDSGSPLIRSDRQQQIGIVSWGLPCARGAPDVFTRISAPIGFCRSSVNLFEIQQSQTSVNPRSAVSRMGGESGCKRTTPGARMNTRCSLLA
ncbi:chymotrypsin-1-like [Vanessa atalanta]|uniref:chymotrypsin-1-like n=1 Tax=Vanessa atalanta TaxID=42275 RepID=UPI001FCE118C|nr:chymotrypsin-1-like [Vanessa atalanta]